MKLTKHLSLFIFLIFFVGQAWGQPRGQAAALDNLFMSMSRVNTSDRLNEIHEHKKEGVTLIKVKKETLHSLGKPETALLHGEFYLIPVPTTYMKHAMSESTMSRNKNNEVPRSIRYLVSQSEEVIENAKGWEAITLQGHSSHFIRNPQGHSFILKFTRNESISDNIQESLAKSKTLQKTKVSEMYSWLPEYAALSSGETSRNKYFGLILRDIKPIEHELKRGHEVIPLNHLWGYSKQDMKELLEHNDHKRNQDLIIPSTIQKQAKKAGLEPIEWILNEYIKPLGEFTAEQNFLDKVQGGNHKQNLLAVYKKGRFQKFIAYDAYDLDFLEYNRQGISNIGQQIKTFNIYTIQSILGELFWPKYLNIQMMKVFMIAYFKHIQKLIDIDTTTFLEDVKKKFSLSQESVNKTIEDRKSNERIRKQAYNYYNSNYNPRSISLQISNFYRNAAAFWYPPDFLRTLFDQKQIVDFLLSDQQDQQISCSRLFQ